MAKNLHELPREELSRDYILREILERIDDFHHDFPNVDTGVLKKSVLEKVIDREFDPNVQIRGFLRAFRRTRIFKEAFDALDKPIQAQIKAFMDGQDPDTVVQPLGFTLPPSPQAKHHFSLLDFVRRSNGKRRFSLLDFAKAIIAKADQLKDFFRPDGDKKVKNLPLVYEDAAATKLMEVII